MSIEVKDGKVIKTVNGVEAILVPTKITLPIRTADNGDFLSGDMIFTNEMITPFGRMETTRTAMAMSQADPEDVQNLFGLLLKIYQSPANLNQFAEPFPEPELIEPEVADGSDY